VRLNIIRPCRPLLLGRAPPEADRLGYSVGRGQGGRFSDYDLWLAGDISASSPFAAHVDYFRIGRHSPAPDGDLHVELPSSDKREAPSWDVGIVPSALFVGSALASR
jgi:hypothetical protein